MASHWAMQMQVQTALRDLEEARPVVSLRRNSRGLEFLCGDHFDARRARLARAAGACSRARASSQIVFAWLRRRRPAPARERAMVFVSN